MRPGDRRTVASIDGPAADELAREGILPGVEVAVVSRAPLRGPFVVDLGGARLAISADVAAQVRTSPRSAAPGRA
jgi:Fe2+ transport system protein FeoA